MRDRWLAGLLVVLASAWLAWRAVFDVPQEDAAILMRYAQHLAGGHGLVWNIGEPPVEGATDFLFVVVVGGVSALGVGVVHATWATVAVAHVITVALVFLALRRVQGLPAPAALVGAAAVALGPGVVHVSHGFGAPFFALVGTATAMAALELVAAPGERGRALVFALAALALGLTRPEGVILAALLLIMVAARVGVRRVAPAVAVVAVVGGVLGGAYFVWRWRYFGLPLPLPFYRKGGDFYPHSLRWSAARTALMLAPLLALLAPALVRRATRRGTLAALVPVVGFALAWGLLSDAQNVAWRYQYPVVPLAIVLLGPSVRPLAARLSPARRAWPAAAAATLLVGLHWHLLDGTVIGRERLALSIGGTVGLRDVGRALAPFADRGHVLATTEAGVLPLTSGWVTLDTWGLNSPAITRRGRLTWDDLDERRPAVVLIESHDQPYLPEVDEAWERMNHTLVSYARARGYRLAAVFGPNQHFVHIYYVRADLPDTEDLVGAIRGVRYIYWNPARNYADDVRAGAPLAPQLRWL